MFDSAMVFSFRRSNPEPPPSDIELHGAEGFAAMRRAGRIAADALEHLGKIVAPGVTTNGLDIEFNEFVRRHNAAPALLQYRGFPRSIVTSVNQVACNGVPNDKPLHQGDIVSIDSTVLVDGWHGTVSRSYPVGEVTAKANRLIDVTYECALRGIAAVKPGARTGDIGYAIQSHAESAGCSVIRDFCGFGVGRKLHDKPNILNYGRPGEGQRLVQGMIFTIMPIISSGRPHLKILSDGWTAITRDRSLAAQFKHTVGVTDTGAEVFTLNTTA